MTHNAETPAVAANDQPLTKPTGAQVHWKFFAFLVAYTVAIKVLPYVLNRLGMDVENDFGIYPWNFSPMFAVSMFGGAMLAHRGVALLLPIGMMLLGDLGIWAISGRLDWAFYPSLPIIYGALLLCAVIGFFLRQHRNWFTVLGGGVLGCLLFFVITNFASWVSYDSYPKTWSGLLTCYAMGLPFLRNSLIATTLFSGILFSPYVVANAMPVEREELTVSPETV